LYLLNDDGKFQAYEYEYGEPFSFPDSFLRELSTFIQKNGLRGQIAITSSIPKTETGGVEIQLGSQATVTFQPKPEMTSSEQQASGDLQKRTFWQFNLTEQSRPGFCFIYRGSYGGCFIYCRQRRPKNPVR
jgi:hypothetical protein